VVAGALAANVVGSIARQAPLRCPVVSPAARSGVWKYNGKPRYVSCLMLAPATVRSNCPKSVARIEDGRVIEPVVAGAFQVGHASKHLSTHAETGRVAVLPAVSFINT
jgi:hypothetical protein